MNQLLFNKERQEQLLEEAAKSERLRVVIDLRTSPEEESQRMLNGLIPGTVVPIHRHEHDETAIILRGRTTEVLFDNEGNETACYELCPEKGVHGLNIPANTWHTVIVHEPTVLFEGKGGKYKPSTEVCPFEDRFLRK